MFKVSVNQTKCGQPRPYADSEYEYEIEVEGQSEYWVKLFCTQFLRPKKLNYQEWAAEEGSAATYFAGYYTFTSIGENKYRYYVKEPFTD